MKVLETERLLLRPFQLEDKAEIHRLVYADPQVAPFWSSRTWAIEEITESFARKLAQRANGLDFQAIILSVTLMKRLGLHLQRNLKPTPFTGPWRHSPGVIGILENPYWQRKSSP